MPHLIEEYAKHCGVQIGNAILGEHFYPLVGVEAGYITIDTSSPAQVNQYFYWTELIDEITALMAIKAIESGKEDRPTIIRIAHPDDKTDLGEDIKINNLSVKQINYIVKNSLMHFSIDGPTSHIAAVYNTPQVVLFSNSRPEYSGPYKASKSRSVLPEYKNGKPSFSGREEEPVINTIYPDKIITAAHELCPDLLAAPKSKVYHIGQHYHHKFSEIIPDFCHPIPTLTGRLLNIRMDLSFRLDFLQSWLKTNKCSIITSEIIPVEILKKYRRHIPFINFFCEIGKFPPLDYLQQLKSFGIQHKLYYKGDDCNEFRAELNKYFDFNFERLEIPKDILETIPDGAFFKSNKLVYSKDGVFLSRAHLLARDFSNKVIKSLDFVEELPHLYIYGE